MTISVTYTGQLAEAAGRSDESVDVDPGATLATLLDTVTDRHGDKFTNMLRDGSGSLRSTVLVVLDGTQATGDRESLPLDGVNEIMFMTPIAGG